ncbi:rhodanese-like domain-containing protein [Pontibacter actiniarum]|uniref:Rhodanese-like domain-containing protein n=1 Tax=Pontibacter actiniarum TaxID=323450 RepID=A0A1X9YSV0_9BACT|nr:rhodanese-like domain-containing protein [Pontibacter actiniarum]ARS35937.1 rhodanese-like domain-containing protein [Pontibacter actiniarum]
MKKIALSIAAGIMLFGCATAQQQGPAEVKNLTPDEFKEQKMNSRAVLIDVRTPEEYATGHLDGAVNSDYRGGDFAGDLQRWDKDKVYYLYCATGNRSSKAAELLKEAGFKHIYNIGGFQTLKESGLPTTTEADQQ